MDKVKQKIADLLGIPIEQIDLDEKILRKFGITGVELTTLGEEYLRYSGSGMGGIVFTYKKRRRVIIPFARYRRKIESYQNLVFFTNLPLDPNKDKRYYCTPCIGISSGYPDMNTRAGSLMYEYINKGNITDALLVITEFLTTDKGTKQIYCNNKEF
jgi:hypothetical protein